MFGSYIGISIMSFSAPTTSHSESLNYVLGIVCTLAAALCMSFVSVATNKMKGIYFLVIVFYLSLMVMTVSFLIIVEEYLISGRVPYQGVTMITTLKILVASAANFFATNMFT